MKRIYRAANLPEAHLVRDLLAHVGIAARIFNENAQGGLGEIPFTEAYPEVWLERELDLERARRVLDEYRRRAPDTVERRCPACGEPSPGEFQICWNCGKPL